MSKFRFMFFAVVIMSIALLGACGTSTSSENAADPKQLLVDATNKSMEINSAAFEGDFVLSLDMDESMLDEDQKMVVSILKDLKINYTGAYQADIEKLELVFESNLNIGDLKTVLEVPILINEEKIWIKVPAIPGMIPDEYAGKHLELDMKQLAEMSGEEYISIFDTANSANADELALIQNIVDIFIKNVDDSLFAVSTEENDTVVTVDFSGDNFYSTLDSFFENSIPEFITLLEDQKYADLLGLTSDDLAELKELENGLPPEAKEALDSMKEMLTIDKAELISHINQDGFVTNQEMVIDFTVNDEESGIAFSLGISSTQQTSKINEEQEFSLETPTEDIIDLSAMLAMFMPVGMDGDFADFGEEMEMERVDELFFSLFEQDWFNDPQIEELLFTNMEFQEALYDEEVLEKLLNDEEFRKSFFSQYGVELN